MTGSTMLRPQLFVGVRALHVCFQHAVEAIAESLDCDPVGINRNKLDDLAAAVSNF
jgi:hypothetical protein